MYIYSMCIYRWTNRLGKDKIRDTRARVFLIGECGGKRSCHGLLTGPLPHQPPQPLPTMPTPPTPMPRPPCAPLPAVVVRSAAAGRWRHREPVVDRRHPCTAGLTAGRGVDRRRSKPHENNTPPTLRAPKSGESIVRVPRGTGPCSDTGFLDVTQYLLGHRMGFSRSLRSRSRSPFDRPSQSLHSYTHE